MSLGPLDRLRAVLGRKGLARDVSEEISAHLAHRVDDLVAQGLDADEAEARAREEFGDPRRLTAECLEARGAGGGGKGPERGAAGFVDRLRQDVSFALRQLRRAPGFATVAVLTLALGIASTSTIVAVVEAVVLAPLPFVDEDRVIYVEERTPAGQQFSVSEPNYVDWRERATSFTSMGAMAWRGATLQGRGDARAVTLGFASASLLPTLGVEPLLGRSFVEAEDEPGTRQPLTVLTHGLWQEVFGGDAGVLGQDVVLDGRSYEVIGVLPPDVPWLDQADLMVPLGANPTLSRGEHYLDVWGRLAPGATLASARAEMTALAEKLGRVYPVNAGWGVQMQPIRDVLVGAELDRAGWVLMSGAALLLLIACVNVSNLLLARASVRRGELALRAALGAGRRRITAQLFTESAVLAMAGGALGLLATLVALPAVRALGAERVPRLDQAAVSPGVWAACLFATAVAAVLFGLAPRWELRPDRTAGALRGAGSGGRRRGRGLRDGLVVGQVALSAVLLVSTGLLVRSFTRLASVDPGFEADGTLTARVNMPDASVSAEERAVLLPRILEDVRAIPGVVSAGATAVDPFSGQNLMNFVAREDRMPDDARDFLPVSWRVVTPGFVEGMGMDLLAGRAFEPTDDVAWDGHGVMIGESLARHLWPEADGEGEAASRAVGTTLVWGDPEGTRMQVVGVVGDLNDWRLNEEPFPVIYRPHRLVPWSIMTIVVRVQGDPAAVADGLRTTLRTRAPGLALPEIRTLGWNLRRATAEPRFHALLMAVFAAAGLALALVGVYGITAFSVDRRMREIGIRLSLGGDPGGIGRMVLLDSVRLALLGALLGGLGAWMAGRALASLLFRTEASDPLTWAAVASVLFAGTLLAAWIPARRAARVDPSTILGAE